MSLSVVSFGTGHNFGSGNLTITAPSSIVDGNLLLAGIAHLTNATKVTPPAGWSTAVTEFVGSAASSLVVFYKIASAESGNYVFTAPSYMTGSVVNISGNNTSTPIDVAGVGQGGGGTTATALSVTTVTANTLIFFFQGTDQSAVPGLPAGYTDAGSFSNGGSSEGYGAGWIAQAGIGATGDQTGASSNPWSAVLVAIKAASAGGSAFIPLLGEGGLGGMRLAGTGGLV